uniref:Uncharacterized protein n=1 Tax=Glossina austeni TaxID=7395 RepID=A0A1A9VSX8_GLOAU
MVTPSNNRKKRKKNKTTIAVTMHRQTQKHLLTNSDDSEECESIIAEWPKGLSDNKRASAVDDNSNLDRTGLPPFRFLIAVLEWQEQFRKNLFCVAYARRRNTSVTMACPGWGCSQHTALSIGF